jgi:DNA-binding Lrp family transcriptional regulator
MATQAYVFVYAAAGKAEEVAKAIGRLEGVKSASPCWGRPDVIALVEAPTPKALSRLVLQQIQAVPGIEATDTRLLVEV